MDRHFRAFTQRGSFHFHLGMGAGTQCSVKRLGTEWNNSYQKTRKEPPFLTEYIFLWNIYCPFPRTNNKYNLWNRFKDKASIPLHPEKMKKRIQVPLASAKWFPKMWRKLKILGGLNTEQQVTHVAIASLAFPLLEKGQKQRHWNTRRKIVPPCFHRISNRGLWVQTQWTVPVCIPNPGMSSSVNSSNLGSSFIKT